MTIDQERRVAPRFSIQAPTEYEYENSTPGAGITENVSSSGVLIEYTSAAFPIDTELRMRFSFFHGSFDTVFTGAVVRYTEDGFAARFVHLDTAQIEVLHRALSVPPPS
jgi:hypothetical protein